MGAAEDRDFCSFSCGNKYRTDMRRREAKLRLVAMGGGCCVKCGFDDPVALEFHHRDPATKRFTLGNGDTLALATLLEELAKCDLLCANCHRQVEAAPFRDRWELARQRLERPARTQQVRVEVPAAERNIAARRARDRVRARRDTARRRGKDV